MTEQNTPSTLHEEKTPVVETPPPSQQDKPEKTSRSGPVLGAIAIVLVIALGVGGYYHGHRLGQTQLAENQTLQNQLNSLKQTLQQTQEQYQSLLTQQTQNLQTAEQQQAGVARQLEAMQAKVASLSGNDTKMWLLAQADFLVKMAGRKLWGDQDVTTAAALLKSADISLADMNDPSLMAVRKAVIDDIGTLSNVSQVDFDGIILKVNQLSNQVDNLRLADDGDSDQAPMDQDDEKGVSGSVKEWRQNLVKSWHSFMADFITVRPRDATDVPLLAPDQDIYLRENIRSRLLVAAQAVPRHQTEVYKQSLETISTWVRAYFDVSDNATKAFLDEIDSLSQQSIAMDVPSQLSSQPLLEKLMQTRVRNLLAQPAAATPATAPAQEK